jgi:hypothetical protein
MAADEAVDEGAVWPIHTDTCRWDNNDPIVCSGSISAKCRRAAKAGRINRERKVRVLP